MNLPIKDMLKDVEYVEGQLDGDIGPVADLCCHVKALADEVERLEAGYEMMLQIVSHERQWHYKVARAVMDGRDMRKLEDVEAIR
jgi:hypothetical protein